MDEECMDGLKLMFFGSKTRMDGQFQKIVKRKLWLAPVPF